MRIELDQVNGVLGCDCAALDRQSVRTRHERWGVVEQLDLVWAGQAMSNERRSDVAMNEPVRRDDETPK